VSVKYLYGRSWHESGRFPVAEMTEAQAKKKFAKGPQLGVIAGPDIQKGQVPAYVLTMNGGAESVSVHHYAATGSIEAILSYRTIEGRLFLFDVTEYLYPDDGEFHFQDECTAVRSYLFEPDGSVNLRSDVSAEEQVLVEEFSGVDVSPHWRDPIGWGEWDAIGTAESGRPTA
jgi:hypothetical protein